MRKLNWFYFSVLLTASPAVAFGKGTKTVALLYNSTNDSSSTSNVVEGHIKNGFELAIKELGKDLNFVWINVGEKVDTTIRAFGEIQRIKPDLIVGPSHSFQVIVLSKMLREAKFSVPLVTPTGTSTELLDFENVTLVSNSNGVQAKILMSELRREKLEKILVVQIKDCVYCSNFVAEMERQQGRTTFKKISLDEAEIETSPILSERYDVQAIVVPALEIETAKIIDRLSFRNSNSIFWSADGVGSLARFVQQLNRSGLKFRWLSHYHAGIKERRNVDFVKKFLSLGKGEPVDTSAFYYEALKLGADRFLRKELVGTEVETVTGTAQWDGKQIVRPMPLLELKDNRPRLVKMVGVQR